MDIAAHPSARPTPCNLATNPGRLPETRAHGAGRIAWTAQADDRLARLRGEGASLRGLARVLGLSRSVVAERAALLGLHSPAKACDIAATHARRRPPADPLDDPARDPLPAGHALSWGLITAGTCLEGAPYTIPSDRKAAL